MNVTQVAVRPSEASQKAGRPALTPELLAASGARYSRNNEGLQSILSKIDPHHLEKSVDSIFRMVDYGHQSIADMVPVAMFLDDISIWLAYYVWTLCPTAGGQESSTRYIKISIDGLVRPKELGIREEDQEEWQRLMKASFRSYETSLKIWESLAFENPAIMGIPKVLLDDKSELAQKKVARMRRNYAFDRARYFLPVTATTNVMLIMSARGWVNLCQHLFSQPLEECRRLAALVRNELEIAAPRMTKYARATDSHRSAIEWEFDALMKAAQSIDLSSLQDCNHSKGAFLEMSIPPDATSVDFADELKFHSNRYAPFGYTLQRTPVRFGWSAIGFAEIRDLNRHRTGTKYCPQIPLGFYCAMDQLPPGVASAEKHQTVMQDAAKVGKMALNKAISLLRDGDPTYLYWTLLGTEFRFEHTTTADKFLYEAELRTGIGAHYRYAKHLRDVLAIWYERFPSTKGIILEGSAEPE